MATPTKLAPVTDDLFERTSIEVKGRSFTFRELSAEEYDECVRMSTNPETKEMDNVQLLRWMIIKASEDPKLSPDEVAKLPFGIVGQIGKAVNDLHFGPLPQPSDEQSGEGPKGS